MAELYNPIIHTSENLAQQLETLPDRGLVLAGSIGRAAWLGQLFSLERPDHSASDIDIIDTHHGLNDYEEVANPRAIFEEDTKLTRSIRPISASEWGLYIPKRQDEPYAVIDAEHMQPSLIEVPWSDGVKTSILSPGVMVETIGLFGPYKKHQAQVAQFREFTQDNRLPLEVQHTFQEFRRARAYGETVSEHTYILLRRAFLDHTPSPVKSAVVKCAGPVIRQIRGTVER